MLMCGLACATESFEKCPTGAVQELQTEYGALTAAPGHAEVLGKLARTGKKALHIMGGRERSVLLSFEQPLPEESVLSFWLERWTKAAPFHLRLLALTPQGDTIYLDSPFLDVTYSQIDTAGFVMHPIKGQMKYPVTFKEILPWAALALVVAVAGYLLYRYIKRRKENRGLFERPVVQDPPHIVALRELDRIRGEQLWQNGEEKLFYTGVTDALREYIEARYNVSAMEKTTSEIMEDLSDKKIEPRYYKELDELFKTADLVKFAKYVPQAAENEEAIPMAVRFVNAAFEQQLQEAAAKENAAKEKAAKETAAQEEAAGNDEAKQREKVEE